MKVAAIAVLLMILASIFSGCESVPKNARQTVKNVGSFVTDGYQKDMYESR